MSKAASCPVPTSAQTILPSVTGEGEVLFPRPFAKSPPAMFRFQSTFPSARERHMSHWSLLASGLITKTRSPWMIGVAPEMPGISTDHFTPSVGLNFSGNPFSGEVPLKAGPRHWVQFSAWAETAKAQAKIRAGSFMAGLIRWRIEKKIRDGWLHNPARSASL